MRQTKTLTAVAKRGKTAGATDGSDWLKISSAHGHLIIRRNAPNNCEIDGILESKSRYSQTGQLF